MVFSLDDLCPEDLAFLGKQLEDAKAAQKAAYEAERKRGKRR